MAGYTTKTVHDAYCFFRFPTNGQAKELPTQNGTRLEGRPREPNRISATQGRVTSVTR